MISAILLAAGESRRMGKPKQLLPFGSSTILAETVNNLLDSRVDEVIVVLGFRAEEMMEKIDLKPVRTVVNPVYRQGMSTSMIAGLNLVASQAQAVMFALGDQPVINSQTINRLIAEFCNHDKGIAIPTYQDKRGHPVIFAIRYRSELLRLKGDIGGREIIDRHPEDVLEVAVNCEGVCIDIDTGEQLQLLKRSKLKTKKLL